MQWVKPLYVCLTAALFTQPSVRLKARARIRRIGLASYQGRRFDRLPFVYKRWCCERVQHSVYTMLNEYAIFSHWWPLYLSVVCSVSSHRWCCQVKQFFSLHLLCLFGFQNWINYWRSKKEKRKKEKKRRERERERERERDYYELIAGLSFNLVFNKRLPTFRTA